MIPPPRGAILPRAGALGVLRSPAGFAGASWVLAAGLLLGRLPLLEAPGLESGLVLSLGFALLLGPALVFEAWRRRPGPVRAGTAGAVAATALTALGVGASALHARLFAPCSPSAGVPLMAVVAWPSAVVSCAAAALALTLARGRRVRAALLYLGFAAASVAATAFEGWFGPSASAYDHLLGVWPGPVYDEALSLDRRLLLFRAGTLALGVLLVSLAAIVAGGERPRRRRAAAVAALSALALVATRLAGGGPATRGELARVLGGVREGTRCTVHFPRELSPTAAARALRDCEYDAAAIAGALELARPPRATVWIYRDPAEKRRLVGAGATSFTKPWLHEVHVNAEPSPHPVLRHELVHALAAGLAPLPLRVPARGLVLVDAGLLEGLAVALEVPSGPWSVHAWTRALRDGGRLPPLARLVGGAGFYAAAQARAYTAAGSFVRFLLDRYGAAAVREAYATDDLARATRRTLPELDAEWNRFLDGVEVPPALAAAAEARFARGGALERACVHETADLERAAAEAGERGEPARAEALLRRAGALAGAPAPRLFAAARAWARTGALERAGALLAEAQAGAAPGSALAEALQSAAGDLRWREGDLAGAAERFRAAGGPRTGAAEGRALRAKRWAVEDPGRAADLMGWLLGEGDPAVGLARVARRPEPMARYLIARAALNRDAPAGALRFLEGLDPASLPDAEFAREARRVEAGALVRLGRCDEAQARLEPLARDADTAGRDGDAEADRDLARRCAWDRATFGLPPPPEGEPAIEALDRSR